MGMLSYGEKDPQETIIRDLRNKKIDIHRERERERERKRWK